MIRRAIGIFFSLFGLAFAVLLVVIAAQFLRRFWQTWWGRGDAEA